MVHEPIGAQQGVDPVLIGKRADHLELLKGQPLQKMPGAVAVQFFGHQQAGLPTPCSTVKLRLKRAAQPRRCIRHHRGRLDTRYSRHNGDRACRNCL